METRRGETTAGNQVGPEREREREKERERETDRERQEKHVKTKGGENGIETFVPQTDVGISNGSAVLTSPCPPVLKFYFCSCRISKWKVGYPRCPPFISAPRQKPKQK